MFNLVRIALLAFALGMLTTPLLNNSSALEEFALSLAEDAASQDAYLALSQFVDISDEQGNGPIPQPAGATFSETVGNYAPQASSTSLLPAATGSSPNRSLYLLYHNLRFYEFLS